MAKTVKDLKEEGMKYILIFMDSVNDGLLYSAPSWYASEKLEDCARAYKSLRTDTSRGLVYGIESESVYLPVEAAFMPDKVPDSLCPAIPAIKESEVNMILSNLLTKQISLPEI